MQALKINPKTSVNNKLRVIKKKVRNISGKRGKKAQFGCKEDGYQYCAIPR